MKVTEHLKIFGERFVDPAPDGVLKKYHEELGTLKRLRFEGCGNNGTPPEIKDDDVEKILRVITEDFRDVQTVEWVEPDFCGGSFERWARDHAEVLLTVTWRLMTKVKEK